LIAKAAMNNMTGDVYVFAYSWEPEFCYGKTTTYPGCAAPHDYWKTNFIVHGLWPQYSTGGYPATCTTEAFNSSVPNAVGYNDMVTYWPNVQVAEGDPNYSSFWEHEWSKHGTCTGLSQYNYFNDALLMVQKYGTPSIVSNNVYKDISSSDLRAAYGGSSYASLQCLSGKYLSGVYICFSQSNGAPTTQISCPSDVIAEDTCTSATIHIQGF
jgi:ribonuclease T2